jgi:hypothetical protein
MKLFAHDFAIVKLRLHNAGIYCTEHKALKASCASLSPNKAVMRWMRSSAQKYNIVLVSYHLQCADNCMAEDPSAVHIQNSRLGSNGERSISVHRPSTISSAKHAPVPGASKIPQQLWPAPIYRPSTPGNRPMRGKPSGVHGR